MTGKMARWVFDSWRKVATNNFSLAGTVFLPLVFLYFIWAAFFRKSTDDLVASFGAWPFGFTLWSAWLALLGYIGAKAPPWSIEERLRRQQKERVRVLTKFNPESSMATHLSGSKSIYRTIMQMLERALDNKNRCTLRFLLCTPALDYPENPAHKHAQDYTVAWGAEFREILRKLAARTDVETRLTFLPAQSLFGFNDLSDFVAALSNYCKSQPGATQSFTEIYKQILTSSKQFVDFLGSLKTQGSHIVVEDVANIPFQLIIVTSDIKEMVLGFAGRELLEDLNPVSLGGLYSTDDWVVDNFIALYDAYVDEHRRSPFPPTHTRKVNQLQKDEKATYTLDYLGLGIDLVVQPNVFSPLYGNSSKFTSWVLTKLIDQPGMKVLDIGAGTGVQAIVAWKTLQNLCKVKGGELNVKVGQVVAIEGVGLAFKNLKENCKDKNQITIHNAALIAKTNKSNGQHREGIGARMITQEEVKQLKQGLEQYWVEKGYTVLEEKEEIVDGFLRADSSAEELQLACDFDVVIADLPFVDALPEVHALPEDDPERAFYDMNHREHRTLFAAVKTRWLKKDGLLITSFSGLGGLEDVRRFERLARDMGFQAVQRFDFYEQGHVWMVYAFMRKDDRKEPENWDKGQDDFWLNRLGVKKRT